MSIIFDILEELFGIGEVVTALKTKEKTSQNREQVDPFSISKPRQSNHAPKNVPISKQKTALELHTHAGKTADSKVEKRPDYAGSLGVVQDEGCTAHATERYVQKHRAEKISTFSKSQLKNAIIMSEILGKPKCKK